MSASNCGPVAGGAFRAAALALAALLLGNQILLALESTEGAGLYARSSAVSVMVALAILPVCFEYARRMGAYVLAAGIAIVAVLFLAFAAPASLSRLAMPRAEAAQAATEYAREKIALAEAEQWLRDCRSKYQKCPADDVRVRERAQRVTEARERLGKAAVGDLGTAWIADATGWSADNVLRATTAAAMLGIELGIALLFALAFRRMPPVSDPLPVALPVVEVGKVEEPQPVALGAPAWIAAYLAGCGTVAVEEAHAAYVAEWDRRGKRTMAPEKFSQMIQREARRLGIPVRPVRRKLYAVA